MATDKFGPVVSAARSCILAEGLREKLLLVGDIDMEVGAPVIR